MTTAFKGVAHQHRRNGEETEECKGVHPGDLIRPEGALSHWMGTVKWLNATKGSGFIQPDAGGPSACSRDPPTAHRLSYPFLLKSRNPAATANPISSAHRAKEDGASVWNP